jgi:hypothetical protein
MRRLKLPYELPAVLEQLPYILAVFVARLAQQAGEYGSDVVEDAEAAVRAAMLQNNQLDDGKLCSILRLLKWCELSLPKLVQMRRDAQTALGQPDGGGRHSAALAELRAYSNTLFAVDAELAAAGFPQDTTGTAKKPHCLKRIAAERSRL